MKVLICIQNIKTLRIYTAITIGFTQTVYTFSEGIDFFSEIPIIKGNNRQTEITFSVRFSLSFGNSASPAALNVDFLAAEVQSKDFDPDEQSISFVFEVIDDFEMEATESFDVELSMSEEDLFGVNVGARGSLANGLTLFSRTRVIIIDNDGKFCICAYRCVYVCVHTLTKHIHFEIGNTQKFQVGYRLYVIS